jgi:hypothetical protein
MLWRFMHLQLLLAVAMPQMPHAGGRLPVELRLSVRVIERLLTVREVTTLCHGHYGSRYRLTVRGYAVDWPIAGPAGSQGHEAELFNTAKVPSLPPGRDAFTFWGTRGGLHLFQPLTVFRHYGRFPIDSWITAHGLLYCRYLPSTVVDWWYRSLHGAPRPEVPNSQDRDQAGAAGHLGRLACARVRRAPASSKTLRWAGRSVPESPGGLEWPARQPLRHPW